MVILLAQPKTADARAVRAADSYNRTRRKSKRPPMPLPRSVLAGASAACRCLLSKRAAWVVHERRGNGSASVSGGCIPTCRVWVAYNQLDNHHINLNISGYARCCSHSASLRPHMHSMHRLDGWAQHEPMKSAEGERRPAADTCCLAADQANKSVPQAPNCAKTLRRAVASGLTAAPGPSLHRAAETSDSSAVPNAREAPLAGQAL